MKSPIEKIATLEEKENLDDEIEVHVYLWVLPYIRRIQRWFSQQYSIRINAQDVLNFSLHTLASIPHIVGRISKQKKQLPATKKFLIGARISKINYERVQRLVEANYIYSWDFPMALSVLVLYRSLTLPHVKLLGGDIVLKKPKENKIREDFVKLISSTKQYRKLLQQYNFTSVKDLLKAKG